MLNRSRNKPVSVVAPCSRGGTLRVRGMRRASRLGYGLIARSVALLLLLLPVSVSAGAGNGGFEASFSVSTQKATIGDEIIVAADIVHDDAFKLEDLPKDLQMPPFVVKRVERVAPKKAKGITADGFRIALTIFETGRYTVPSVPIRFKDPAGKAGVIHTEKWSVEVFSVLGEQKESKDIRPMKDPLSLETEAQRRRRWIMIGLGMLGLLVLMLLGWMGWKRFEAWRELHKPAHQRALEALDRLDKKQLIVAGQHKLYYDELTGILKLYIIRRFGVGSPDETTREFITAMNAAPAAEAESDEVRSVLNAADLVKFARDIPTAERAQETQELTRQIILRTVPAETTKKAGRGKPTAAAGQEKSR